MVTQKLISNEYRTISLSNPAVAAEAAGGEDCIGYRLVNGNLVPTGYAPGTFSQDPLDALIEEEEQHRRDNMIWLLR